MENVLRDPTDQEDQVGCRPRKTQDVLGCSKAFDVSLCVLVRVLAEDDFLTTGTRLVQCGALKLDASVTRNAVLAAKADLLRGF